MHMVIIHTVTRLAFLPITMASSTSKSNSFVSGLKMIGSFGFVMVLANLLNTMGSLGTAIPCGVHVTVGINRVGKSLLLYLLETVVDVVHADADHLVGLDNRCENGHGAARQHMCSSGNGTKYGNMMVLLLMLLMLLMILLLLTTYAFTFARASGPASRRPSVSGGIVASAAVMSMHH